MTIKRIFGYVFIAIAIILTFAVVGQLPIFIKAILDVLKIFTGQLNSGESGFIIGTFVYWLIHISLIIFLSIIGKRWINKVAKSNE